MWVGEADLELLRAGRERQAASVHGIPDHVFTTLQGKAVSPRYVEAMVKRYTAKAGIEKNVHPHTLRHSFATDLYGKLVKAALFKKRLDT